ncbi:MAG TPA: organomercurial lyase [Candidatus Dormibacteraeota bacterium]|nr:organomercurial lyase [Candidatus Dormibacteraeota bacterium]
MDGALPLVHNEGVYTVMPDDFKNRVRVRLYELFVESGRCPSKSEVAADLGCGVRDVADAFNELAAAHMLVLQPGSREVLMANPLSAIPTPFAVETQAANGQRSWYGNCIWDALGVIAMLQCDGRVLASCGCCGESMTVSVDKGEVSSRPPGVIHFALPARRWWDDIVFN